MPCALHAAAIRRTTALKVGVLEVEVNPKLRVQIGMPIRDHVDPFDRRDLLDILQAVERLDRREYDDVLVGPWRVFGGVARSVALVSGVRPLAGDAPVADRRILRQADDRARQLLGNEKTRGRG